MSLVFICMKLWQSTGSAGMKRSEVRNYMLVLGLVFQRTFAPSSLLPLAVLQSGNQLVGPRAVSGTPSVGEWSGTCKFYAINSWWRVSNLLLSVWLLFLIYKTSKSLRTVLCTRISIRETNLILQHPSTWPWCSPFSAFHIFYHLASS